MTSLLARLAAYFVEPPAAPPPAVERPSGFLPPAAPQGPAGPAPAAPRSTSWVGPAEAASATPTGPAEVRSAAADHAAQRSAPSRSRLRVALSSPSAGSSTRAEEAPARHRGSSSDANPATFAGAAVLGSPAAVVPVAAACAGELRARARAAAALLCIWRPAARPVPALAPDASTPPAQSPAGATTPGARRLAARLAAHELVATACGRLAWLALDHDPPAAAAQVRRCVAIADGPVVIAIAGPRPAAFESLLVELDLALAVLPSDIDPALRELALATLPARQRAILAPLPPGPPRWAAMAGLARLRSLPDAAR